MISTNRAGITLLFIFGFLFIFHCLVIFGLLPYDIVWAGRINNQEELMKMESISLLIVLIAILLVSLRIRLLKIVINPRIIAAGIWILFVFFVLNTLGNLSAKNSFEKYGFGLLTFVISSLVLRLAIADKT